jgi:hypothetical protein
MVRDQDVATCRALRSARGMTEPVALRRGCVAPYHVTVAEAEQGDEQDDDVSPPRRRDRP